MQNSNYNHTNIEKKIYEYWEKNKFFKAKKNKKKEIIRTCSKLCPRDD